MSDKSSDEIARSNLNILIQTAITQEQERIIKLLESKAKHCKQIAESIAMDEFMSEWDSEAFEVESKFALELIELIKGENK